MLLPTLINTTTARHVELIDYMNLTCFIDAKITLIFIRNSKSTSDLSQGFRHALFFFKSRDEEEFYRAILVLVSSFALRFNATTALPPN